MANLTVDEILTKINASYNKTRSCLTTACSNATAKVSEIESKRQQVANIVSAQTNTSVIKQVIDNDRFLDGQLKIGTPDEDYSPYVSTVFGIVSGRITTDGVGTGTFQNHAALGSQANLWIHIPLTRNGIQILSLDLTILKFGILTEKFTCNSYLLGYDYYNRSSDTTRFTFQYVNGQQYVSFKLISSFFTAIRIDAITGGIGRGVSRSQFGLPQYSFSSVPA